MSRRKTTEEFSAEVHALTRGEYVVMGRYINNKTKTTIRHVSCGNEYFVRPNDFLSSQSRCPFCYGNLKKTHTQFVQEVKEATGDAFMVLGKYVNADTPVEVLHLVCGHRFATIPDAFLRSRGCCSVCSGTKKKTTQGFVDEVIELVGDEYEVLGEYVNSKTPIKMRHSKCGETFHPIPNNFLKGSRCPRCRESKGEKAIMEYLRQNNIEYMQQYKFRDCRWKAPLPFDFAVFSCGELVCLIEYDGELHYQAVDFYGGEEAHKLTLERDRIKTDYCRMRNIPLIRIPYWEYDNIQAHLDEKLSCLLRTGVAS